MKHPAVTRHPGRTLRLLALSGLALGAVSGSRAYLAPGVQHRGHMPPHPMQWLVEEAALALGPTAEVDAPESLLQAARQAIQRGLTEERAQAALVLGFAGREKDRELLTEVSADLSGRVEEHAAVALGLLGGPESRMQLAPRLAGTKREDARRRAIAAFALGLDYWTGQASGKRPEEDGAALTLTTFAQRLLERNIEFHAAELLAALFALPPEEGRALLYNILVGRRPSVRRVVGPPYLQPRPVPSSSTANVMILQSVALGLLAARVATAEELRVILNRLNSSRRHPLERYRALWGFHVGGGRFLSDKLKQKASKVLQAALADRRPELAAMGFLALMRIDARRALKKARSIAKRRRTRSALLAPAMIILGKKGEAKDRELLALQSERRLSDENQAALSLGLADLAKRLEPESWPLAPDAAEGKPPFPILELRAQLDMADRLRPGLGQVAAAVALARLGDHASAQRIRGLYLRAGIEARKRSLALALIALDPKALGESAEPVEKEKPPLDSMDSLRWERLAAFAYSGHPQLWLELMKAFAPERRSSIERTQALQLAAVALAQPIGSLGDLIRKRLGPGSLILPLEEIMDW